MKISLNKLFNFKDIDCFKPANGESISIKTKPVVQASISVQLLKNEKSNGKIEILRKLSEKLGFGSFGLIGSICLLYFK